MKFETERLRIREILDSDFDGFYDLHRNKNVMGIIPTKTLDFEQTQQEFSKIIKETEIGDSRRNIRSMIHKSNNDFIGLCAAINRNDSSTEIGYRVRESYWRKGYGTEVVKGIINFIFGNPDKETITAVASKKNIGSLKILEMYMSKFNELYNEEDREYDLYYRIEKKIWLQQGH